MTSIRRRIDWVNQDLSALEKETKHCNSRLENIEYIVEVAERRLKEAVSTNAPVPWCFYAIDKRGEALIGCDQSVYPATLETFKKECLKCQNHVSEQIREIRTRTNAIKECMSDKKIDENDGSSLHQNS